MIKQSCMAASCDSPGPVDHGCSSLPLVGMPHLLHQAPKYCMRRSDANSKDGSTQSMPLLGLRVIYTIFSRIEL